MEYRTIPNIPSDYLACSNGQIFSKKSNKFLKPRPLSNGYLRVCLVLNNGSKKDFLIHRLICSAWYGANENLCVNHKDCNKTNNRPENLEWCSYTDNMKHASLMQCLQAQSKRMHNYNIEHWSVPVKAISPTGSVLYFKSMADAVRSNRGFLHSKISRCVRNLAYTHRGYRWSIWDNYPSTTEKEL